jgi:hypothetical protein
LKKKPDIKDKTSNFFFVLDCFQKKKLLGLPFETLDPWCKEAIDFINVIGNRLIAESGDSKSKKFLFERISLAIQRGNAASIRGTFPDSAILSEIFVL